MTRSIRNVALAGGALAGLLLAVAPGSARPVPDPVAPTAPAAEGEAPDGKAIFLGECKKCHGEAGKGDTRMGRKYEVPDMTTKEWQDEHPVDKIVEVVTDGIEDSKMDSFTDDLSAEEIRAVAEFVKTLGG
ncbi:MAG: c-type cytochrome [Myxococcota bacterium]